MKTYLYSFGRSLVVFFAAVFTAAICQAQTTATWIGPATGGTWNTDANWDTLLTPGSTTNIFIGVANNISYNAPMTATGVGLITNVGTLNINAAGFNAISIYNTNIGSRFYVNSGGVVNVSSDFTMWSNSAAAMYPGSSVTIGRLIIGSDTNNGTGGNNVRAFASFTNWGGNLTVGQTLLNPGNNAINITCRLLIADGINNLGALTINRLNGGASAPIAYGSDGMTISNGLVTASSITLGNNAHGVIYQVGGTFTNSGAFTIRNNTSTRPARFLQTGGFFSSANTNVLMTGFGTAGNGDSVYAILGGTNTIGGVQFGAYTNYSTFDYITNISSYLTNIDMVDVTNYVTNIVTTATNVFSVPTGGVAYFTNAATINIGSLGMISNGMTTISALLNTGGRLFSAADWTNAVPLTMNGGSLEAQDINGTPHNIYSPGQLRGSGPLIKNGVGNMILTASNIYSGSTLINAGTLKVVNDGINTFGSIASSLIINVGSGATFDVAQAGGFVLGASRTMAGKGTVVGAFGASDNSTISPAASLAQGTLTFSNGLAATNIVFNMELSDDPTGLIKPNDAVNVVGDLTVSGVNNISVVPIGSLGTGTYKLIKYTGALNGNLANFSCLSGTLTNPPGEIDLIVVNTHLTTKLFWRGDGAANLWDTVVSSNWFNGTSLVGFYSGDTNVFDDSATSFTVNLSGILTPASGNNVLVNATNTYTFGGSGSISSITGFTKTNSGRLNMWATNNYAGITTISGGTLSVPSLANGGISSPIGSASSSSANIVLNNGTLEYTGGNATVDRGMTFQSSGGTLVVSNSTLTLSGLLTGAGTLTKNGNGQLSLPSGNDYTGGTIIKSGTIRTPQGSGVTISALGSGNLTLNGTTSVAAFLFGADQEVLNNTLNVLGTMNYITNSGNNTLSVVTGSGTVYLEGTGANVLTLQNSDLSGFTGTFYVDTLPNLRMFSGNTFNAPGATIDLGNNGTALNPIYLNNRNGNLVAQIGALFGGPGSQLRGASSADSPSTYLIGGKNIDSTFSGAIVEVSTNRIVNLVKVGTGTLKLQGGFFPNVVDTTGFGDLVTNIVATNQLRYTGSTTISNGVLKLTSPNILTNSPIITLASATAVLDALAMGYSSNQFDSDGTTVTNQLAVTNGIIEIISGERLAGIGTILASNVLADAGSIVNPGLPYGNLTVNNKIQLAGTINMNVNAAASPNASAIVATNIVIDGTAALTVSNLGPEAAATFHLFSKPVSGFASVVLPTLSGTNSWVNNLAVDGSITMIAPQLVTVNTTSTNITTSLNGNQLTLTWPADHTGWRLQAQTNTVADGLGTNWVDVPNSGSSNTNIITINPANGTVFFRLIYP